MTARRRPRNIAKGTMQGKVLSEEHKTAIVQTYALVGNKEEVGRICGVSSKTVRKVLTERRPSEVQAARAKAAVELSEKVHAKVDTVLDKMTPEKLEAASASQLAVVGGIFIDKLPVLERYRNELLSEHAEGGGIPLPEDANAMIKMLANKVKKVELLRVELRDPEMERQLEESKRLLDEATRASEEEIVEAEFEELDFDNPGKD